MIEIKISDKLFDFIFDRSLEYTKKVRINNRGDNRSIQKQKEDHFQGKFSEFVASYYLAKKLNKVGKVDLTIHNYKRHDADLIYKDGMQVHVKTATPNTLNYGLSWCFNTSDPLILEPEKHLDENIILMYVDIKRNEYKTTGLMKWKDLFTKIDNPVIPSTLRKCIYAKSL